MRRGRGEEGERYCHRSHPCARCASCRGCRGLCAQRVVGRLCRQCRRGPEFEKSIVHSDGEGRIGLAYTGSDALSEQWPGRQASLIPIPTTALTPTLLAKRGALSSKANLPTKHCNRRSLQKKAMEEKECMEQ